jgi:hypothetical protein
MPAWSIAPRRIDSPPPRRHAIAPGSLEARQAAALQLAQQALDDQTRYAEALSLVAKSALLVLAAQADAGRVPDQPDHL